MSKFLRVLFHPVTSLNLVLLGSLIVIGNIHNHAHYAMDIDTHAYVRNWCKKNITECKRFISSNDY